VVKIVRGAVFLRLDGRWDILNSCRPKACCVQLRGAGIRSRCQRLVNTAAARTLLDPTIKFQEFRFHAETHISTQSAQPLQDARLSQPHEDQERRSRPVAPARPWPQACFRERGLPRLVLPLFFHAARRFEAEPHARFPKEQRNGDMPEATFDWRSVRLRKHADFQRVYQASRRLSSASMSYFFRIREAGEPAGLQPRIGFTVGRVLGNAVRRNRIRRRMREAVRLHLGELPARVDVVLHPRVRVVDMEFERLQGEVSRIFTSIAGSTAQSGASK
jgi:ribonuclease P protein component